MNLFRATGSLHRALSPKKLHTPYGDNNLWLEDECGAFILWQEHTVNTWKWCMTHIYFGQNVIHPCLAEIILENIKFVYVLSVLNKSHIKYIRIFQNFKHKLDLFALSVISGHWYDAGSWNPFSWKTRTSLFVIVHIIATDGLVT